MDTFVIIVLTFSRNICCLIQKYSTKERPVGVYDEEV